MTEAKTQTWYTRFTVAERVEHWVLFASFTTLGVTGLVQKFATAGISQAIIGFLGGIETTRIIHHWAAAIFLLEAVYHIIAAGYRLYVQKKKPTLVPGLKDVRDALQWVGYNLGFTNQPPKMPRYNFMEKMEYWAVVWGLVIMGVSGLMMWNPIFVTRYLPGFWIPTAKAAHGYEAILAVLAIIIWHFYNVHLKHWNWSMIRGQISRHEMIEEHGQELEEIESGKLPVPPPPEVARRRSMVYLPISTVVALALAGLIYYALTFETTSITTLPPAERVQAYVPATPTPAVAGAPVATLAPGAVKELAFTGTIDQMLKSKCGACHGDAGGFNVDSYQNVRREIVIGSPYDSPIVQIQKVGTHPGQLDPEQLNTLIAWIQAGAPENPGGSTQGGATTGGAETWDGGISALFKSRCGACHGTSGGFSAATYADVTKQLKPGDPDNSAIVKVQQGSHPGKFTADELARVIAWIKAGAPEK